MAVATAASPSWTPPPSPDGSYLPPPVSGAPVPVPAPAPAPGTGSGSSSNESLRLKVAHWMEDHFGKAYLPIAMAGGAAVGGGLGFLTLGPVGALAGGAAGALLGGVLVFAG